jgi:hypothetical protein
MNVIRRPATRRELDAIDAYIGRKRPRRKTAQAQVLDYSVGNLERLFEDPASIGEHRANIPV